MRLWLKIAMVGVMTLAILIPLMLVRGVIAERQRYRDAAVADISRNIGGAQRIAGPVLEVPFSTLVEREVTDNLGQVRVVRKRQYQTRFFFPKQLNMSGELVPETRRRGLHEVRVYEWKGAIQAQFDARIPNDSNPDVGLQLGQPRLHLAVSDVRGLRGQPRIWIDGREAQFAQGAKGAIAGMHVLLDVPQPGAHWTSNIKLRLTLAGTETFSVLPVGEANQIELTSRWPHPSFNGLLPRHDVDQYGFRAIWSINALATDAQDQWRSEAHRALPAQALDFASTDATRLAQVSLLDPVNPYALADRATKYGILFVLLTFVGFFMFELIKQIRVHPIQYALVGLAIAIFFLLLVSLSEHVAFGWSYLVAAAACIGLIGFYLCAVLKSVARGVGFAAMLATLYATLYGLLVLEDNALAVGAGLLFVILAAIMVSTRKVDWYALSNPPLPLAHPFDRHANQND